MIGKPRILLLVFIIALGGGLSACLDEVPEELTAPSPQIPRPFNLRAVVGLDSLTLYWDADPDYAFSGFAVYRSDNEGAVWMKIGEAPSSPFGDGSIRSGLLYLYRISGLNPSGLEGNPSVPLIVETSLFSISINAGDEFTNQRSVVLFLTASSQTQHVRFSEDPDLGGAEWISFQSTYDFTLSPGDGTKTVYAQFMDKFGNASDKVSDTIILDMQAAIDSLTFSPPSPIQPGAALHFRIVPVGAETGGTVFITMPGLGTDIVARDDGSGGDTQIGDGAYERDFKLPSNFRGTDILMTAVFIDEAGNQSDETEFPTRLDMTDPPSAVALSPVVDSTTTSITLRWSQSDDEGFFSYDLYRDDTPGITQTTSTLVTSLMDREATLYTDNNVFEGEAYYYAVYVVNDLEESAKSNERLARTDDILPTAVVLDTLSSVGPNRVTLTWSRNDDTDFDEYLVFMATAPGVGDSGSPEGTITDRYQTYLDVTGLDLAANTYYFRVFVYDKAGHKSRSNEVSTE
ncbi:MAG: hypothetical protein GTO51_06645 [Candidatus Latescibacteria bacterium]|nr:hypothetical protein [Candidatus Latescibacterota bacterium]NIM21481.1 hypothetical protein [Candidatus Latescibacterota bacterium]NIM65652.1 hypothetical protein [Candidatus Latescibacterota bacterium]NIO02034.1 hypothetical protein [Candidatus Latescibacterota bacterium]NIO28846.1 hypothetical protein [Candidatus Latescibacterota bacterium]